MSRAARSAALVAVLATQLVGATALARADHVRQQPVDQDPSYITVVADPSPSLAGEDVMFTASMRGADGSPITVGVLSVRGGGPGGAFELLRQPLDANGQLRWTMPADRCCGLLMSYADATRRYDSSSYVSLGVLRPDRFPTSLAVASGGPSPVDEVVTFTATVSAARGVDGGTVTFVAIDPATGAEPLRSTADVGAAGRATTSGRFVAAGNYVLTATYSGTDRFEQTVGRMTQSVGCAAPLTATALTLTGSRPVSLVGEPVTFTARVLAGDAPVGVGSVELRVGDVRAVVPISADGTASWTASGEVFPAPGTRTVSASFLPGDNGYLPSTATVDQRIIDDLGFLPGTLTLTISPNPVVRLQPTTATVTVLTLDGQPYPIDGITLFRFSPFSDSDVFIPIVDGRGTATVRFQYAGTIRVNTGRIPETVGVNVVVLPEPAATTVTATAAGGTEQRSTAAPAGSDATTESAVAATVPSTTTPEPSASTTVATAGSAPSTTEPVATTDPEAATSPTSTMTTAPGSATSTTDAVAPAGLRVPAQVPACPPAVAPEPALVVPFAPSQSPPPVVAPVVALPVTGSNVTPGLPAVAALLVLGGSALVLTVRRRGGHSQRRG